MPRIRQDDLGLYVAAGGYRGRPINDTAFNLGDEVKARHRNQSTVVIVRSMDGAREER